LIIYNKNSPASKINATQKTTNFFRDLVMCLSIDGQGKVRLKHYNASIPSVKNQNL